MLVDGLVESNRVIWPTHRTWGIITMFAHRRNLMPTLRSSPRTSALLLLLATPVVTQGQVRQGLCSDGFGVFQTSFFGVKVTVGAAKKEGFATRACSATLEWGKNSLPVVPEAAAVDIDALGVDLGLESPIVALQVKNSDADWFVTYKIYSLEKPPRLLRTVSGGSSFNAADTDLDGRIEIWTDDAGAVNGMDRLSVGELDFPPTTVLRFEKHKLIDVSAEFQSFFDHQIAQLRGELDSKQLGDFRNSDGKLSPTPSLSVEQMHHWRLTKIKVLEIVWAYLYSGREQQAWEALAEMWPPSDLDRIRSLILNARTVGIRSQVEGVDAKPRLHVKKFAYIYETAAESNGRPQDPTEPTSRNLRADVKPQAILLRRLVVGEMPLPQSEEMVDIVIDAAGKVRSAKTVGNKDRDLMNDCAGWKFIPAFKDGRPVASRMRLALNYFR